MAENSFVAEVTKAPGYIIFTIRFKYLWARPRIL